MDEMDIPDFLRNPERVRLEKCNLRDAGFRFVRRGKCFFWCHLAEIQANDVDCTDMSDEEFSKIADEFASITMTPNA